MSPRRQPNPNTRLRAPGWTDAARAWLARVIRRGAGRGLPVTFDFDNTIVCGDIGEATLAVLVREGKLTARRIPRPLSPAFRPPNRPLVRQEIKPDLTAYYDAYLSPTAHGSADTSPQANGYVWAVEAMEGLRVTDVVAATEAAYARSIPGQRNLIEVTPGRTAFQAPFFHPEMVELIAVLLRHDFDVWVVSASNVWTIRWMVLGPLNRLLKEAGRQRGLAPDRVLGVSTLLTDPRRRLLKDSVLVRTDAGYAQLREASLRGLRLTSRLQFPPPVYSGKVAAIWDAVGRHPYLAAGDSPGDHAMLTFSEHRLWIGRMDKPAYLRQTARLMTPKERRRWCVQPVRAGDHPGFATNPSELAPDGSPAPPAVRESIAQLRNLQVWTRG